MTDFENALHEEFREDFKEAFATLLVAAKTYRNTIRRRNQSQPGATHIALASAAIGLRHVDKDWQIFDFDLPSYVLDSRWCRLYVSATVFASLAAIDSDGSVNVERKLRMNQLLETAAETSDS